MAEHFELRCPIRGLLKTSAKRKDGLKPSEEFFRVEAIKHLISQGYPNQNFKIEPVVKKFGNAGRNSLRADFAVLDCDASAFASGEHEQIMEHAILLCEVKRENKNSDYVKETQVEPLLDFAKKEDCVALYWDDVDQRVFWSERKDGKRSSREGPLAILPNFGRSLELKPIVFGQTSATDNLEAAFDRIEDILHSQAIDPEQRFQVILQLLLARLFDEHKNSADNDSVMAIQDYRSLGVSPKNAITEFNETLSDAVTYYQKYLPKKVDAKLSRKVTGDCLCDICEILAPVRLIASKREVIQSFYMKFSKGLYKWDMAQYFTPPKVTEYIVDILNPQFGEHIKDPACGSADFLTAAFHLRRTTDPGYASCIWGADNSPNAVQVAVLNMLLNGDGKTNIKEIDSLEAVNDDLESFKIVVCNPPFGKKIKDSRPHVLRNFDLGHVWSKDDKGRWSKEKKLLADQEKGILFLELCVKQVQKGGRIGIIVPNGYLGNRSDRYALLREWIIRQCKIVAICSFPRFTFKTSGADVSASILYLEKRDVSLADAKKSDDFKFSVQMIENVGVQLGDKKALPLYRRNQDDGSYIIGEDGNRILDADFQNSLNDLRNSEAVREFRWLTKGHTMDPAKKGTGWSLSIKTVLSDGHLTLDPKRLCRKVHDVKDKIRTKSHVSLSDIVDVIGERTSSSGKKVQRDNKKVYRYVELQDMGAGAYSYSELRGWELPSRARHFAEEGDIYVGSIWGSVTKWCYIGADAKEHVVTNGCHRLRIKKGKEAYLTALLSFFCSEAYAVQMRSLARGSDGLAEVTSDDLKFVLVPTLTPKEEAELKPFVDALKTGAPDLRGKVTKVQSRPGATFPYTDTRNSHVILV